MYLLTLIAITDKKAAKSLHSALKCCIFAHESRNPKNTYEIRLPPVK